jgi:hypothetical protein
MDRIPPRVSSPCTRVRSEQSGSEAVSKTQEKRKTFESPNRCPEPCKPVSGKAGPVRSEEVCHDVCGRDRWRESPTGYGPATHG